MRTNLTPGVTVIITAYNYGHLLPEAVQSALNQTHKPVEVIVIDDGSTDNTPTVAAAFGERIRYIHQENQGLPKARNAGLHAASHDWVVFLDADDDLCPWMIEEALKTAREQSEMPAVVFGGDAELIPGESNESRPRTESPRRISVVDVRIPLMRNSLAPTALVQKKILLDLGGFDPLMGGADDRDMWIRISARHRVIRSNVLFYRYRLHATSMSHNPDRHRRDTRAVLAKAKLNPDVKVPFYIWRETTALMHMQSAYTYGMANRRSEAVRDAFKSILSWPWLGSTSLPAFPTLGRLMFITRQIQHLILPSSTHWFRSPQNTRVK
jgi:glycosyltransferase involved in cell wall biosynthesis